MSTSSEQWLEFQRRPKILLVDDEPSNIRILNELFRGDCDVFMAKNGQQAIDVCVAELPDIVLMDIIMPELDGMQALRKLKSIEATAQIPVIFVTGQDNDEEEALSAGAVDFITKPFRTAIVRARVRTHLALKYQRDLLSNIAMIDGLTGVPNRRRFDEALQIEWHRCARDKHPISLAMIDVDFFKAFNDTYGHQTGDTCLLAVARTLQKCLHRPYDLLARYGGEEFVCLLPQTMGTGADIVVHRMLAAVRDLAIPHASYEAGIVTVSIGLATMNPTPDIECKQLIGRGDKALYAAKHSGRNKVEHFES